jgi:heterodisulfide reductase subunit D
VKTIKEYEMQEYYPDVHKCIRCGFCVNWCPGGFSTWESYTPRGRMQTIRALLEKRLEPNANIRDAMYKCVQCAYCTYRCPAGVRCADAIKATRAYLVQNKLSLETVDNLESTVRENKNIYALPTEARTEWIDYFDLKDKVKIGGKADLVYFGGCVASLFGRALSISAATSLILNKLNVNWTYLGAQEYCCGNPLFQTGKLEHAEELAKLNRKTIQETGAKTVLTACPGCYRVFVHEYPRLIGDLGVDVIHISQYLEKKIDEGKVNFTEKVEKIIAYHDPCELGRHIGVYEPPRKVLSSIPGVKLVEFTHNRNYTQCCGAGGVVKGTNPKWALELGKEKLDQAHDIGAEMITSTCPTCKLNILDSIAENEDKLETMDLTELVARAMGLPI